MPVEIIEKSKVILKHSSNSLEIYNFGATVTSFKVDGIEKLFLSENAITTGPKGIRGGIPIVFPQFGPKGALPQHGFARISTWDFKGIQSETATALTVMFELDPTTIPTEQRKLWPFKLRLLYIVSLYENSTKMELVVMNTGIQSFSFTALLHTYFRVKNVQEIVINGLTGYKYTEFNVSGNLQAEKPVFTGEVDRTFLHVKEDLFTLKGPGIEQPTVLIKNGFKDVVLWNPYIDNAKKMADFGDNEWKEMICLEVGCVGEDQKLEPGDTWRASQTILAS